MRLILIRHGETPSNVAGDLDTARPGAPLTPLGHRQADALPAVLTTQPIAAIHASALGRTQLTAAPLATSRGIEVAISEGLEEISAGSLEMHTEVASIDVYAETVAAWIGGDLGVRMPGAEDRHTFFDRYDAAVRALADGQPDDGPSWRSATARRSAPSRPGTAAPPTGGCRTPEPSSSTAPLAPAGPSPAGPATRSAGRTSPTRSPPTRPASRTRLSRGRAGQGATASR